MILLDDLKTIIPDIVKDMEEIVSALSIYKDFPADHSAKKLLKEVRGRMKRLKSLYKYYKFYPEYKKYNYEEFVSYYRGLVK